MQIFRQKRRKAEFCLTDFRRLAFRVSINPHRSSVMAERGSAVLDGGTFVTGTGGDNREIKTCLSSFFFFSNTFPFIGMVRLMRIAHKKMKFTRKSYNR